MTTSHVLIVLPLPEPFLIFDIFNQLEDGFINFLKDDDSAIKGEFFLPDQIQYLIANQGQIVELLPAKDKWLGVTYSDDLNRVATQLNE